MWMALVRQKEKKPDQAETLFKASLDLQDPTSIDAAITMQLSAAFLRRQGREDEAKELESRAAAIRKAQTQAHQPRKATAGVYKIGPGITAPQVLQKVEPKYGLEAKAAGFQGTVAVYAEIGTDGIARNLRILAPLGLGLDEIAMDAISQWRFRPGTKDGQPVTVEAIIEVNFTLAR